MNRQAAFNLIFLIFIYGIKNKLINAADIIIIFDHISNYFYEEFFNLIFS